MGSFNTVLPKKKIHQIRNCDQVAAGLLGDINKIHTSAMGALCTFVFVNNKIIRTVLIPFT